MLFDGCFFPCRLVFQTCPACITRVLYLYRQDLIAFPLIAFSGLYYSHHQSQDLLFAFAVLLFCPAVLPTFFAAQLYGAHTNGDYTVQNTLNHYPRNLTARVPLHLQNQHQHPIRSDSISTICHCLPAVQEKWSISKCHSLHPHSIHWPLSFRFVPPG